MEDNSWINHFYPFVDHITTELPERFSERNEPAMLAAYLVPRSLKKRTEESEEEMLKWYHEDLPGPEKIGQEIECWKHKFQSEDGSFPTSIGNSGGKKLKWHSSPIYNVF